MSNIRRGNIKICLGDGYQWEGGGYKEKWSKGEYGGNILYKCM
jgi:hypothetical protein